MAFNRWPTTYLSINSPPSHNPNLLPASRVAERCTRVVLYAGQLVEWCWGRPRCILVTKEIAAVVAMACMHHSRALLEFQASARANLPENHRAGWFIAITGGLLVEDLKKPLVASFSRCKIQPLPDFSKLAGQRLMGSQSFFIFLSLFVDSCRGLAVRFRRPTLSALFGGVRLLPRLSLYPGVFLFGPMRGAADSGNRNMAAFLSASSGVCRSVLFGGVAFESIYQVVRRQR